MGKEGLLTKSKHYQSIHPQSTNYQNTGAESELLICCFQYRSKGRTHFRSQNNQVWNFWSWTIEHKRQLATSTASIADNWFYETTEKTKKKALNSLELAIVISNPK